MREVVWILLMFGGVWRLASGESSCPIQLRDVTRQTGIEFVHTDGSSGRRYIVETVCCGLALLDHDMDGDVDIYFLNGAALPGTTLPNPARNALYRNDGNWRFTDVTEQAGVGDTGYGLGVCTGDYDNDGDTDIYVNNFGPNVLYRNNANGTFTDFTRQAGVEAGNQVGAGAAFDDLDNDGDIDAVILNSRREPTVLRNDSPGGNHWIQIRLRGTRGTRDGVGARIRVLAGDWTGVDEVHRGRGYQSHYGMRLHFGLGPRARIDRIEMRWLGGATEVLEGVSVDQFLEITEGRARE